VRGTRALNPNYSKHTQELWEQNAPGNTRMVDMSWPKLLGREYAVTRQFRALTQL